VKYLRRKLLCNLGPHGWHRKASVRTTVSDVVIDGLTAGQEYTVDRIALAHCSDCGRRVLWDRELHRWANAAL
jgi:hypothetical protein